MPKTLKITWLAASRQRCRGRVRVNLPPDGYEGLKSPASEEFLCY